MDTKHPGREFVLHFEIAEHLLDGDDSIEGAASWLNSAINAQSQHGERVEAYVRPLSEVLAC